MLSLTPTRTIIIKSTGNCFPTFIEINAKLESLFRSFWNNERESVIIFNLPVTILPAGWHQNLESLQSQDSEELVSISRSEIEIPNLLKLSIALRIGLLYL